MTHLKYNGVVMGFVCSVILPLSHESGDIYARYSYQQTLAKISQCLVLAKPHISYDFCEQEFRFDVYLQYANAPLA